MSDPTPTSVKVVIVGESTVGKSSLAQRFVKNEFDDFQETTVGACCLSKLIAIPDGVGKKLRVEIWDTAGQERYRGMAPLYYRNAKIALVVYDVTKPDSLTKAEGWVKELTERLALDEGVKAIIALVASKVDLPSKVDKANVDSIVTQYSLQRFETSAKTGLGVQDMFDALVKLYLKEQQQANQGGSWAASTKPTTLELPAPKQDKKCC